MSAEIEARPVSADQTTELPASHNLRLGSHVHAWRHLNGDEHSCHLWYANHIEAVYVIESRGELINDETAEAHRLEPGVMYLVDAHQRHTLRAHTRFRAVCVFDPPLTGREVHDENGVFPLLTEGDR
jgi:hypothetical protein